MTMITPEQEIARMEELYASVQETVSGLRREIENLKQQAESGEEINATAVAKTVQSISDAIGRCQKAELQLNDCRNRQAGIARGGYALDLDKARAEIGCRLDRLRCSVYPK
jgi:chromosome segregation ATPase